MKKVIFDDRAEPLPDHQSMSFAQKLLVVDTITTSNFNVILSVQYLVMNGFVQNVKAVFPDKTEVHITETVTFDYADFRKQIEEKIASYEPPHYPSPLEDDIDDIFV